MRTGIICTLAVAVVAGCGRSGSQRPETPAPENEAAVGYGVQSADKATGSVASYVPTEAHARTARLGDMLIGRVPGLEVRRLPNGDYTLRIRGPSSLMGSVQGEEPLLVLDGTPVPRGSLSAVLSAIPPRDIARVDVLRDASTTSIYGMRGAHGVVVITTKLAH